jgi:hypothetical protein
VFFDSRNAMYVYSYNIFRIGEILEVFNQKNPSVNLQDLTGIALNVVLAIIMAGMLILLNIAMLVAFAVRMVMIWVMLIFSPVMAIDIVFTGTTAKIPQLKKGFLHTFVTLSFMPAVCGFILSIGLIMFTVLSKALKSMPDHQILQLGGFKVFIGGNLLPGFGSLQEVILALVVMIIIWTAIFAMFKTNTLVQQATGGLEKMGKSLASTAGKGLTMIPIIPTGGKGMSLSSIGKVVNDLPGIVDSYKTRDAENLRKSLGLKYATEQVELSPKALDDIRQLTQESSPAKRAEFIKTIFNEVGTGNKNLTDKTDFIAALQQTGIDPSLIEKWKADPVSNAPGLVDALKKKEPNYFETGWNPPTTAPTTTPETPAGATTTATGPTVTVTAPTATNTNYTIEVDGSTFILKPDEASKFIKSYDEAQKLGKLAGLTQPQWSAIQSKLQAAGTKPAH